MNVKIVLFIILSVFIIMNVLTLLTIVTKVSIIIIGAVFLLGSFSNMALNYIENYLKKMKKPELTDLFTLRKTIDKTVKARYLYCKRNLDWDIGKNKWRVPLCVIHRLQVLNMIGKEK